MTTIIITTVVQDASALADVHGFFPSCLAGLRGPMARTRMPQIPLKRGPLRRFCDFAFNNTLYNNNNCNSNNNHDNNHNNTLYNNDNILRYARGRGICLQHFEIDALH